MVEGPPPSFVTSLSLVKKFSREEDLIGSLSSRTSSDAPVAKERSTKASRDGKEAKGELCAAGRVPRNSGGMDGWKEASLMRWAFPFVWLERKVQRLKNVIGHASITGRTEEEVRKGGGFVSPHLKVILPSPHLLFCPSYCDEGRGKRRCRYTSKYEREERDKMSGSVTFWVGHPSDNAPIQLQVRWMSCPAVASPYKEEQREITTSGSPAR